ncbi:MAG: hypothetical protein ACRENE_27955 [Polyangiaceae bacterium]
MLASAPAAHAGTLRVVDETHQLGPSQVQSVSDVLARAPFDGRLVVTSDYADAQDLARYLHTLLTSPSLVVVGLDPVHRHVQVRFGEESGVPRAQWADVERSGNDAFRHGDWAGGASAIFQTAARSAAASPLANPDERARPSRQVAPAERPSMFGSTFLVLGVLGVIVAGLYFISRRRDGGGGYSGGYGPGPGPGYGPGGGYGGGYGPPVGGMGPVGGGLIGAGLGGLAGYELGKAAGEREERDRDDRGSYGDGGGGGAGSNDDDYDAGGGGSSWDDGGGGSDGGGSDGGGSDF